MNKPAIRIAVLHFSHETVSFLKNDTTLDDFIYPGSPASGEALLGAYPKSYMGGFVKMAREFDGVELVGIEVAAVAEDRHRLGLGHRRGLRDLCRQDDRRAQGRGGIRRRLSLPARRHGGARRAAAGGRTGAAGARGGRAEGLHRRDLRSARQRGRGIPETCRHGVRGEIFPALRRVSAGRARGADAGAGDPGRLQADAMSRSAFPSSRRRCCNGPARRRGWIWGSARWCGKRASPTPT